MQLDMMAALDNLDNLRKHEPYKITNAYQRIFETPEGRLALIDLMDKFFEFKPTSNDHESGSQAVVIYIKNNILGVVDLSKYEPPPEGETNA